MPLDVVKSSQYHQTLGEQDVISFMESTVEDMMYCTLLPVSTMRLQETCTNYIALVAVIEAEQLKFLVDIFYSQQVELAFPSGWYF